MFKDWGVAVFDNVDYMSLPFSTAKGGTETGIYVNRKIIFEFLLAELYHIDPNDANILLNMNSSNGEQHQQLLLNKLILDNPTIAKVDSQKWKRCKGASISRV